MKIVKCIPNIITTFGIGAGLASILYNNYSIYFILLANFFDGLDGYVARRINCTSALGYYYDSLADWINYGMITSYHLYKKTDNMYIFQIYLFLATYRLIYFTFKQGHVVINKKVYFIGLPSPLASVIMLICINIFSSFTCIYMAAIIGIFMNSNIYVPKINL